MSWNYRVVRREYPGLGESEAVCYGIHEVYYYKTGRVKLISVSAQEVVSFGGTYADLQEVLAMMTRAMKLPVLDYDTREEVPTSVLQRRGRRLFSAPTQAQARVAKSEVSRLPELIAANGSAEIIKLVKGYGIKVSLRDKLRRGQRIPSSINGVPVMVEVAETSRARPLKARGA